METVLASLAVTMNKSAAKDVAMHKNLTTTCATSAFWIIKATLRSPPCLSVPSTDDPPIVPLSTPFSSAISVSNAVFFRPLTISLSLSLTVESSGWKSVLMCVCVWNVGGVGFKKTHNTFRSGSFLFFYYCALFTSQFYFYFPAESILCTDIEHII